MTDEQRDHAVTSMRKYGGGFLSALAEAYRRADSNNRRKIEVAFIDDFAEYAKFPKD